VVEAPGVTLKIRGLEFVFDPPPLFKVTVYGPEPLLIVTVTGAEAPAQIVAPPLRVPV
jgi:hypothetical protein